MGILRNIAESLVKKSLPKLAKTLFPITEKISEEHTRIKEETVKEWGNFKSDITKTFGDLITNEDSVLKGSLKNAAKQLKTGKFGLTDEESAALDPMFKDMNFDENEFNFDESNFESNFDEDGRGSSNFEGSSTIEDPNSSDITNNYQQYIVNNVDNSNTYN